MRYLWITSFTILVAGAALMAGGALGVIGPIGLVCGLLLLWTGIVKIVVLRIWRRTLASPRSTASTTEATTMSQSIRSTG